MSIGGFETSFILRSEAVPVHVQPTDRSSQADSFIAAYQKALTSSKHRVKAVLFCNPHNPRGDLYPREHIEALLQFCETHDLHLISDEIYALSTFNDGGLANGRGFVSVLQCDLKKLRVNPARVHMVYSISKDLGSSGLRLVCLTTIQASLESSDANGDGYYRDFLSRRRTLIFAYLWPYLITLKSRL